MGSYPKKIVKTLVDLRHRSSSSDISADGVYAAIECGARVRFTIVVDPDTKTLRHVGYETNGCGFMIAASESIAQAVQGRNLTDLHGTMDLKGITGSENEPIPWNRTHCTLVSASAFRQALANYRSKVVEEFHGEKALICTCFGVSEETIAGIIERTGAMEVSDVSAACNAGAGCGSCRMLIQEMIDSYTQ